jgi:2',3'-cyclic-nucleotide 2'-phosphodiesterase (5'-nucleotidase family)
MRYLSPLTVIVACTFFACSQRPLYVQEQKTQVYTISKATPSDSNLLRLLTPYKRGVDTQMQVIIGHTDIPLSKAQPESALGNFVADATLAAAKKLDAKVVAAVGNYGGIRIPYIAPGPITRGKMYELMPFDNMLTIVEIPGHTLQTFCNAMAAKKGWPVSGISFAIKEKKAIDVQVAGLPLNDNLVYKIAINDYIARGGDNCDFLESLRKRNTSIFIRDALIDYVAALEKEGKPLHPQLDKRIRYAE